jgi:hypothetical protein
MSRYRWSFAPKRINSPEGDHPYGVSIYDRLMIIFVRLVATVALAASGIVRRERPCTKTDGGERG